MIQYPIIITILSSIILSLPAHSITPQEKAKREAYKAHMRSKPYNTGVEPYIGYVTSFWVANRIDGAEINTTGKNVYLVGLQNGIANRYDFEALAWFPAGNRKEQERIMNAESEAYDRTFVKLAANFSYSLTDLYNDFAPKNKKYRLPSPTDISLYTNLTVSSFLLDIHAKDEITFVDRAGNKSTLTSGDSLNRQTSFRSIQLGLEFTGIMFGTRLGIENIDYDRPFNIRDQGKVDPVLNEANFNGYGLSFMWDSRLSEEDKRDRSRPWIKLGMTWPLDGKAANITYSGNKKLGEEDLGRNSAVGYFSRFIELGYKYPVGKYLNLAGAYSYTKVQFSQGRVNGERHSFSFDDEYAIASERIHLIQLTLSFHI